MHLYGISPTGGLTPQPYDPANWPPGDGLHWLDGAPAHPAELLPIVAPLRPHPLLLEDLIGPERTTLITRYDDLLYMEFPVSNGRASRSVPYLAILLSPTLLITVPYGAAPPLDALAQTLADRAGLGPGGLDELLIVILGHLIDGARQELLRLRDEVYATSDLLDEDVDAIALEDFAALRRQLGVLAIVAEDQHYCVTNLHPNASHLWTKEQPKVLLRDLINDTDYILRSSARLEQRLDGLHDQYQLALHDRTETRLRLLTIISVIILPLSLITGFFGMNFPDLYLTQSALGQEIVLGLILAVPIALLALFWRAGWFD